MPGSGLISERSHTAGEKIQVDAFGCVRPVLDLNGQSTVRLRAVVADRELDLPHFVAGMPELAKRLKLRKTFCHVLEGFAPHIERAGRQPRPGVVDALALEVGEPHLVREGPVGTVVAPDIDAVLRVDRRNHLVAHRSPDVLVGELLENFHVDRNAVVLHQGRHGGELAVIERDAEADHSSISANMRGSKRHKAIDVAGRSIPGSASCWKTSMSIGTPWCSISADTAANSP